MNDRDPVFDLIRWVMQSELSITGDEAKAAQAHYSSVLADRDRLRAFVAAWDRCEGNRGCYSCVPSHDCRCPEGADSRADQGPCTCGRAELDKTRTALEDKP